MGTRWVFIVILALRLRCVYLMWRNSQDGGHSPPHKFDEIYLPFVQGCGTDKNAYSRSLQEILLHYAPSGDLVNEIFTRPNTGCFIDEE